MATHGGVLYYVVKVPKESNGSVESGWDNPFRPGGDLSREADEIVELIKGGKPITPTPGQAPPPPSLGDGDRVDHGASNSFQEPVTESPKRSERQQTNAAPAAPRSANGTAKGEQNSARAPPTPQGGLDVQRGTVRPDGDASQVEHVTIKKKTKCKCCVIQ